MPPQRLHAGHPATGEDIVRTARRRVEAGGNDLPACPGGRSASNRTDVLRLQVKIDPTTGRIEDACFKTFGCGSAIASSSLATEWLKGKTVEEALAIRNTEIVEELSLPPVKVHCSVLAEDAIKAAIKNYQDKQAQLQDQELPAEVGSAS